MELAPFDESGCVRILRTATAAVKVRSHHGYDWLGGTARSETRQTVLYFTDSLLQ